MFLWLARLATAVKGLFEQLIHCSPATRSQLAPLIAAINVKTAAAVK